MNARRAVFLREMGCTLWRQRPEPSVHGENENAPSPEEQSAQCVAMPEEINAAPAQPSPPNAEAVSPAIARQAGIARMDWPGLAAAVRDCRACVLCQRRKQAVLGVGDPDADWLFIGEGPGAEEDARGEPFVGQAGKLLDAMLASIGLKRGENVYIANAVKCRPEGNRTPHHEEMETCRPFLRRQIALVRPKLIVLLGKAAVRSVLGEERALAAMRKKRFQYESVPVLVTYHPAYLLRNLPDKAKAWEDLCFARRIFREIG
ncbi:MAG: uracil-DNA glycosylase [Zoogloeaceae bacterium]|jgi:DNA polymerase|nr:uracil-DNA glycosylase [Zoogloeaceae bacterium]